MANNSSVLTTLLPIMAAVLVAFLVTPRGLAMGAYTAFLDLALAIANPALGLIATRTGLASVFLVSTLVVLGAAAIAMGLGFRARDNELALVEDGGRVHRLAA